MDEEPTVKNADGQVAAIIYGGRPKEEGIAWPGEDQLLGQQVGPQGLRADQPGSEEHRCKPVQFIPAHPCPAHWQRRTSPCLAAMFPSLPPRVPTCTNGAASY
ncbi:hypothetical protein LIA77_03083 [Sarocladium implicatum]|nr:hypothetical protein LIA77_03083 [Sarocladium implicatum]